MKKINLFLIAALFSANALAVDAETEPNNVQKDASLITPSIILNGQVSSVEDVDWLMFETNQSDTLTFTINKSKSVYDRRLIQVVDTDEALLYSEQIDSNSEENFTSPNIGLKKAGKFFVIISSSLPFNTAFVPYNYELTLNLENQPPYTAAVPVATNCPTVQNPYFSSATGILDFPAIDIDNVFGGLTTYKGSLELVTSPSGEITFKIKEVSPK